MIQRIQSLLLLAVAALMGASCVFPIWSKSSMNETASLSAFVMRHETIVASGTPQLLNEKNVWYIAALYIAAALLALFTVFRYQNRKQQMLLCAANSLLMAAGLAAALFSAKEGETWLAPELLGKHAIGIYLPLVAMLLNMVARRFIRRDEDLVRASDRLR